MDHEPTFAMVSPDPTVVRLRPAHAAKPALGGVNPLVHAAVRVLLLATRVRKQMAPADLDELHLQCVREMRTFEERVWRSQLPEDEVVASSYALCVVIDEAVLGMRWGTRTSWVARSMSMTFHGESSCAQKLLQFVQGALADPSRYLAFLELLYICLSIGFQGGHPIKESATQELMDGRYDLLRSIHDARGMAEAEPLPPVEEERRGVRRWVIGCAALVLTIAAVILLSMKTLVKQEPRSGERVELDVRR
jgi:type VI secretion system protein ImpK